MAELNNTESARRFHARHRGRGAQVWIYLGKLLRMFVYQSDWKVLPMAALIAGLVGMVIRKKMFLNMEGTLMGAFALVCVCIWNGCFNSIQVICRERDVIKREHRSGMHISSYILAHMIYQFLLCVLQTGVTLYVTKLTGVQYPSEGLITPWLAVDLGISMLLITYASDMLSLWVSTLAKTTTTAMTIMPFVLIFQLVFSGGMLTLPAWTQPLTQFTISNPGLKVIAAQADTNNRPFVTISDMLNKMGDKELNAEITVGQVMDLLADEEIPTVAKLRQIKLGLRFRDTEELPDDRVTVGAVLDQIAEDPTLQAHREESYTFHTTLGKLMDLVGRERVKSFVEEKAAQASYKADYALTEDNVVSYWMHLVLFIFAFAALATVTLEFIDKDKR